MNRLILLVSAAAVLLGGCGGSPPPAQQQAPASSAEGSAGGTVVVTQEGSAPAHTLWYARIETDASKPLIEQAYPNAAIALTHPVPAGRYRVVSWHRPCSDTCPASGEEGLGPLEEVCGTAVTVTPGSRVTATVVIDAEGACSVRTGS